MMVTIFGTDDCFHCLRNKQMCEALQIDHEFLNVNDREVGIMFRTMYPDAVDVPKFLWMGEPIGGPDELIKKINDFIANEEK